MKGFKIISPTEEYDDLVKYAKEGALRGVYLGFPNLHEYYTMSLPGVTDWTGFPQSGKTQVLMEFLMNTSLFYGWKHLVYFPDVGNGREILADLIHKYTGKTFDKRYTNHIKEREIANALPWITEHFKVLTETEITAKITPYQFWDMAVEEKKKNDLQTASIDAWKDMSHSKEREFGRTDQYLEDVLSYRNKIAEMHKLHLHTIIHPLKTERDSKGNRKPPGPYDMKGGTEWYNNAKNSVTVHRHDGEETEATIYWNKIKPRSIGKPGYSELDFDFRKFRYYLRDNGKKRFAEEVYYKLDKEEVQNNLFATEVEDDDLPF